MHQYWNAEGPSIWDWWGTGVFASHISERRLWSECVDVIVLLINCNDSVITQLEFDGYVLHQFWQSQQGLWTVKPTTRFSTSALHSTGWIPWKLHILMSCRSYDITPAGLTVYLASGSIYNKTGWTLACVNCQSECDSVAVFALCFIDFWRQTFKCDL